MRLKALFAFLATQLVIFTFWQLTNGSSIDLKPAPTTEIRSEIESEKGVLPNLNHVHFTAQTSNNSSRPVSPYKKQSIIEAMQKLPESHTKSLENIVFDYDKKAHRGLGGSSLIILRAVEMDTAESVGVLIHEIGHVVDLGSLVEQNFWKKSEFMDGQHPIYESDPSLMFYQISWENDKTRKKTAGNPDFVSGYAMTDPFEDFAECYVYYVLHNREFKSKTQTSEQLLRKYNFMKNEVFNGAEFDTGQYLLTGHDNRPWDITVMNYDLDNFLSS